MKKFIGGFLIVLALTASGCFLNPNLQFLQPSGDLRNYALKTNGAEIMVAGGSEYPYAYPYASWLPTLQENPQHPIQNLINGISSSDDWIRGEGSEHQYYYNQPSGDTYYYGSEGFSIANIIIRFPDEVQLNRVVVYTIDNAEYPAIKYGVKEVGLRYLAQNNVWPIVELENKQGRYPGRIQNNREGVIKFRFKSVRTSAIKLCIYDTNDNFKIYNGRYNSNQRGVIRLVEIEAYGIEKADIAISSSANPSTDVERLFEKTEKESGSSYTENFEGIEEKGYKWSLFDEGWSRSNEGASTSEIVNAVGYPVHSGQYSVSQRIQDAASVCYSMIKFPCLGQDKYDEYSIEAHVYVEERTDLYAGSFIGFLFTGGVLGWSAWADNGSNAYDVCPIGEGHSYQNATGLPRNSWHRVKVSYSTRDATFSVWVDGQLIHYRIKSRAQRGESPRYFIVYGDAVGSGVIAQYVDDITVSGSETHEQPILRSVSKKP